MYFDLTTFFLERATQRRCGGLYGHRDHIFLYPDTKRISATVPHGKPHFTLNITLVIYTDCTTVIKSNRIGASGCPGGSDRHYTPNGLAYLESIIVVTLYCITTHKKRQTLKVCLFTKSYFNFISIDLWLTGNACFLLL